MAKKRPNHLEKQGDKNGTDTSRGPLMSRRTLFKAMGATGMMVGGVAHAEAAVTDDDAFGILIDTTRCVGCHNCEVVCAEVNGLPEPDLSDKALQQERLLTEDQWTVVNGHETSKGEIFAKRQCMHCVQPACAAACVTRAMQKTEKGPVVWRAPQCMGCRFCMVSCPFDVPKFEYDSPVPRIRKCQMCHERLADGEVPACVENCPAEALTFGPRSELIQEARRRIASDPDGYYPAIYGEQEVGGTSVLYLASVPFEELGLPTHLGDRPFPELTKSFLYSVPAVEIVLPALLLGISRSMTRAKDVDHESHQEVDNG